MSKPRLPLEIADKFPRCLLRYMYTFIPHNPAPPSPPSPSLQRELENLQKRSSKKTDMYLRHLEDFVLC